jgi:hypothetical protein
VDLGVAQTEVLGRVVVMRMRRWWPCWLRRRAATLMWSQVRNGGHGSNMQQCIQFMQHLVQLGFWISRLCNQRCAPCRMPCNITPAECALSSLCASVQLALTVRAPLATPSSRPVWPRQLRQLSAAPLVARCWAL